MNAAAGTDLDALIALDVRAARNANRVANQLRRQWPERPEAAASARHLRDQSMRSARKHSLARANGWGSAGECPANVDAKTPAACAQVCHVVAASKSAPPPRRGGDVSACVSTQRQTREAIV